MKILISNDDGWQAPGIIALAEAVQSIASIKVVAPDKNRSAASNSLTLMNPIRATQQNDDWYSVDGTPVDCVYLALNGLFDWKPDLVISGINAGPNLGDDVVYSGTVAAAMEGFFHGFPAIAFSLAGNQGNFDVAASVALDVINRCYDTPVLNDALLSINIPDLPTAESAPLTATRLGRRGRDMDVMDCTTTDPRGNPIYWIGAVSVPRDAGPGTDFHAISHGEISVTPLTTDMTARDQVTPLSQTLSGGVV